MEIKRDITSLAMRNAASASISKTKHLVQCNDKSSLINHYGHKSHLFIVSTHQKYIRQANS
jgi:hypothetical protein